MRTNHSVLPAASVVLLSLLASGRGSSQFLRQPDGISDLAADPMVNFDSVPSVFEESAEAEAGDEYYVEVGDVKSARKLGKRSKRRKGTKGKGYHHHHGKGYNHHHHHHNNNSPYFGKGSVGKGHGKGHGKGYGKGHGGGGDVFIYDDDYNGGGDDVTFCDDDYYGGGDDVYYNDDGYYGVEKGAKGGDYYGVEKGTKGGDYGVEKGTKNAKGGGAWEGFHSTDPSRSRSRSRVQRGSKGADYRDTPPALSPSAPPPVSTPLAPVAPSSAPASTLPAPVSP